MKNSGQKILTRLLTDKNYFVTLVLGLCPALITTSSTIDGLSMGLVTLAVLTICNTIISFLKNIIPQKAQLAVRIVITATLVSIVQMLLEAFAPFINENIGIYVPLVLINCLILQQVETFKVRKSVIHSFFDGLRYGLGFTFALSLLGTVRELLGTGKLFSLTIFPGDYGMLLLVLAPGAFILFSYIIALINKITKA